MTGPGDPDTGQFATQSAVDGPFASNPPSTISALLSSLSAASAAHESGESSGTGNTPATTTAAGTTPQSTSNTPASTGRATSTQASSPTTADSSITSVYSSATDGASASSNLSFPPTTLATNVSPNPASTTGVPATVSKQEAPCTEMSCNPGLQAAVAVPVVIVLVGLVAIFFLCIRRRRRRSDSPEPEVASGSESRRPNGGWTRHLRIFSFDTELLVGGRSSASNSVRDGATSQADHRSIRSGHPSVRSLQSAAPAYRDALSSAQPPIMVTPMTQTPRPESSATAPPPYYGGAVAGSRPQTAQTTHTARSDPFADPEDEAVSPVDGPLLQRNSEQYHDMHGDDNFSTVSTPVESREPSIREARVARRVSGRSEPIDQASSN